jgi:hypothetical protein
VPEAPLPSTFLVGAVEVELPCARTALQREQGLAAAGAAEANHRGTVLPSSRHAAQIERFGFDQIGGR